jgi:hypothetical protein
VGIEEERGVDGERFTITKATRAIMMWQIQELGRRRLVEDPPHTEDEEDEEQEEYKRSDHAPAVVEDEADFAERVSDEEDMNENEEDMNENDEEDMNGNNEENGEDDVLLQVLEEELNEFEDDLSPEDLDELEKLVLSPEQPEISLSRDNDDTEEKWINQEGDDDYQIVPKSSSSSYELQTDDDATPLEHDTAGSDYYLSPKVNPKTESVHKNGTYIILIIVLVFAIGIYAKFFSCKKDRRRPVIKHQRLKTMEDEMV